MYRMSGSRVVRSVCHIHKKEKAHNPVELGPS